MMNMPMPSCEILQTCIYPEDEVFGSAEKYLRTEGNVYVDDEVLRMQKYAKVQFDTYYNAFSIPLWQKRVKLPCAQLQISGQGKVLVELWEITRELLSVDHHGFPRKLHTQRVVELSEDLGLVFDLAIAENQELFGLLYPRIIALENVEITNLLWTTSSEKHRHVKLGISITHFNRKHYVIPTMKRLKEQLLDTPQWSDIITCTIVDNSQNLTPEEVCGATIIPNENTGGTGGFMRGFLHYAYNSDVTHVLFMDDDASFEIESIRRAYQILSYAVDDTTAVGAALFYEDSPNFLIERGAYLSKRWVSVEYHNAEVVPAWNVLNTELSENTPTTYMGWWFAAFPIQHTKRLVPPFFVRGDDAAFTQVNDFNVIYANGIACYGQSFHTKISGTITYFDTINPLIVNALFTNHMSLIFALYTRRYMDQLVSGRYGYVDVMRLALKNFKKLNTERFVESIHFDSLSPTLKKLTCAYELKELALDELPITNPEALARKQAQTCRTLAHLQ